METWDPGYRVNRCREGLIALVQKSGQGGLPAPGILLQPCSRAGNTPHNLDQLRGILMVNADVLKLRIPGRDEIRMRSETCPDIR